MSLESIYYIGQTIAVVAILATLLAVVFQLQQASRQMRDSNTQARAEFSHLFGARSADIQRDWFGPGGANETMIKALFTDQKLTSPEQFEFGLQMAIFFGTLNESEVFRRRGLLNPETVEVRRQIYRPYLSISRVRKWWDRHGRDFFKDAGSVQLVEEMIAVADKRDGSPKADASSG